MHSAYAYKVTKWSFCFNKRRRKNQQKYVKHVKMSVRCAAVAVVVVIGDGLLVFVFVLIGTCDCMGAQAKRIPMREKATDSL